ncbi:MAG: 23S rRNA (adenine(2503)-C(2))-methyltransferase RlmN, partial [Bacteroidaceae bacterium]|nr:23S rRNA (adenine(2503)-C(2))-methyltransferase RlmN [Bacteroidaceae bacterium]
MMEGNKRKLLGMTLDALKEAVKEAGMPAFTAKQIADWVYAKRVRSIDEMSNISLNNRKKLSELFE